MTLTDQPNLWGADGGLKQSRYRRHANQLRHHRKTLPRLRVGFAHRPEMKAATSEAHSRVPVLDDRKYLLKITQSPEQKFPRVRTTFCCSFVPEPDNSTRNLPPHHTNDPRNRWRANRVVREAELRENINEMLQSEIIIKNRM